VLAEGSPQNAVGKRSLNVQIVSQCGRESGFTNSRPTPHSGQDVEWPWRVSGHIDSQAGFQVAQIFISAKK
jgi:hypothetical protein